MKIKVLGSSSDGNCTLIKFDRQKDWIMFDAGISYIKKKLEDIVPEYCFITHNHSDHISRVNAIQSITQVCGMYEEFDNPKCSNYVKSMDKIMFLEEGVVNKVGQYEVTPLPAEHDTDQPVHYFITDGYESFFYGCDCAYIPHSYDSYLVQCTAIMVECDYDSKAMATNIIDGRKVHYCYDKTLKHRVVRTHCSTNYIKNRFDEFIQRGYTVILGHISNNYNSKENMKKMIGYRVIDRTDLPYEIMVV